jgi:hypothetical protein
MDARYAGAGGATHWFRIALGVILLGLAFAWPIVEIGPTGPLLLKLTSDHGVDAGDLVALIPFAVALVLLWPRRRPAGRNAARRGSEARVRDRAVDHGR